MSDALAQAMHRVAFVSLSHGSLALLYCFGFSVFTKSSPTVLLPTVGGAFVALASFMAGRGLSSEMDAERSVAAHYYSLALSYCLIATAAHLIWKAVTSDSTTL